MTQCFSCYEFGHSQKGGCFKMRRCKRCLVLEPDHVCQVELVEATEQNGYNIYAKYQCCNCKEFGHPPTYQKCIKNKEAVSKARAAKEARNRRRWEKNNPNHGYVNAPAPAVNAWAVNRSGGQQQQPQQQVQQQQQMYQAYAQPQQVGGINIEEEVRNVLGIDTSKLQSLAMDFIARQRTPKRRRQQPLGCTS